MSTPFSNCCNAPMRIMESGDGTNYYVCTKCGQPCDPIKVGRPFSAKEVMPMPAPNTESSINKSRQPEHPVPSDPAQGAYRIVCAAMLMDDGLIVPGVRHFSPDMRKTLHRIYGDGYHLRVREQGFIDTRGEFLDRERAWWRAVLTQQIREQVSIPGELYSENLY